MALAAEIFVEAFNFLSRSELCTLELTTHYFSVLIQRHTRPLLIFDSICIDDDGNIDILLKKKERLRENYNGLKFKYIVWTPRNIKMKLVEALPLLMQKFVRANVTTLKFIKITARPIDEQNLPELNEIGIKNQDQALICNNDCERLLAIKHIWSGKKMEIKLGNAQLCFWKPENNEILAELFDDCIQFDCLISALSNASFPPKSLCVDCIFISCSGLKCWTTFDSIQGKEQVKSLIEWIEESPTVINRDMKKFCEYLRKEEDMDISLETMTEEEITELTTQKTLNFDVPRSSEHLVEEFIDIWKEMFLASQNPAQNVCEVSFCYDHDRNVEREWEETFNPTKWTNEKTNETLQIYTNKNWLIAVRDRNNSEQEH